MEDGNLVLLAGKVAFKVYRGLLTMLSLVFADMITTAHAELGKKIEGCAVVEMHDSPEDLKHLLRALLSSRHRV